MAVDRKELKALLSKIDANLSSPGTICLIGSGATILLGQVSRQTDEIDVWTRASRVAMDDLRQVSETAGLGFDPKEEFPPLPYVQIVHPGIVQVPGWDADKREWMGEPEREVWKGERLTVTVPPPSVLVASKLVRGDDRDFEDCLWLMAAHGLDAPAVLEAVKALPRHPRRKATDNLEILGIMHPD